MGKTTENDLSRINTVYSCLGHRFLLGEVEAAKYIYGNIYKESPPLIETISQLQYCLTAVEILNDTTGIYSDRFLYYWGMICIGETSRLITKDLGTAEVCFKKIKNTIPIAEARLAFIELLITDELHKSEINIKRLDKLRKWAGKKDFFSMIALAKIIFYQYLDEGDAESFDLPIRVLRLLHLPCQHGHPVAIRFLNLMLDNLTCKSTIDDNYIKINDFQARTCVLYDI